MFAKRVARQELPTWCTMIILRNFVSDTWPQKSTNGLKNNGPKKNEFPWSYKIERGGYSKRQQIPWSERTMGRDFSTSFQENKQDFNLDTDKKKQDLSLAKTISRELVICESNHLAGESFK